MTITWYRKVDLPDGQVDIYLDLEDLDEVKEQIKAIKGGLTDA